MTGSAGRSDDDAWRRKEPIYAVIRQTDMTNDVPRIRLLAASGLLLFCAAWGGPSNATGGSHAKGTSDADGTSSASCAAPYLDDRPSSGLVRGPVPTVRPGAMITIYGHWYTSTCDDTGGNDPLMPLPPVHLTLTLPGGDVQELGVFHPTGQDMGFSIGVRVPPDTRSGTAIVGDTGKYRATYEFKVGQ
jgi:hypothetical protein